LDLLGRETSTTEAADVRRLGELVGARGASALDVPVYGGCHRTSTGNIAGVQLISTGEAFMVAKRVGIDLPVAYDAIRVSSGNSFVHETEGQLILNSSYNIQYQTSN